MRSPAMTTLLGTDARLAAGSEWRSIGDQVILRAPGGTGHLAVSPAEAQALTGVGPPMAGDAELLTLLNERGLLEGSTPDRRRFVITPDGLEVDVLSGPAGVLGRILRRTWSSPTLRIVLHGLATVGLIATVAAAMSPEPQTSPRSAALLIVVLQLFTGLFHEMGHAAVTAANGRRVGRLGIGIYFGAPCFYVDSTDAMFLPRRARIAQATAGIFAELVVAGPVLLLAAALSGVAPGAGRTFALVAISSTLVNLSPFLKLDGYWALTDYLNRPQLAEETKAALKTRLRGEPANRRLVTYGLSQGPSDWPSWRGRF